jgi:hypothetical protein
MGIQAAVVQGQVDARIKVDHLQFLLYEPVTADLVIRNLSGRNLELQPSQFFFLVKFDQNRSISRLNRSPITEPIQLPAGSTVTNRINFSQCFRIRDQGPYTIGGRLNFFGRTIDMPHAYLDVVPGITVKELKTVSGGGDESSLRNLRLMSNYRNRTQHLFLWIEDPSRGLSYGVYDLGGLLSTAKPQLEAGENSMVHVLHRSSPAQYIHSVFTMKGTPVQRDVITSAGGVPTLIRRENGNISVSGGGQLEEEGEGESRIRAFTLDPED